MESMEDMEELEKLREKKLAERDERIQNITSLIIKLCYVLLAIAVSLMFFYVRNDYKTYTDSKVVKADVIPEFSLFKNTFFPGNFLFAVFFRTVFLLYIFCHNRLFI